MQNERAAISEVIEVGLSVAPHAERSLDLSIFPDSDGRGSGVVICPT